MDETKIAAFYDDPVKSACDAWSSGEGLQFSFGVDRYQSVLEGTALGPFRGVVL